jgi:hypothetical protein
MNLPLFVYVVQEFEEHEPTRKNRSVFPVGLRGLIVRGRQAAPNAHAKSSRTCEAKSAMLVA